MKKIIKIMLLVLMLGVLIPTMPTEAKKKSSKTVTITIKSDKDIDNAVAKIDSNANKHKAMTLKIKGNKKKSLQLLDKTEKALQHYNKHSVVIQLKRGKTKKGYTQYSISKNDTWTYTYSNLYVEKVVAAAKAEYQVRKYVFDACIDYQKPVNVWKITYYDGHTEEYTDETTTKTKEQILSEKNKQFEGYQLVEVDGLYEFRDSKGNSNSWLDACIGFYVTDITFLRQDIDHNPNAQDLNTLDYIDSGKLNKDYDVNVSLIYSPYIYGSDYPVAIYDVSVNNVSYSELSQVGQVSLLAGYSINFGKVDKKGRLGREIDRCSDKEIMNTQATGAYLRGKSGDHCYECARLYECIFRQLNLPYTYLETDKNSSYYHAWNNMKLSSKTGNIEEITQTNGTIYRGNGFNRKAIAYSCKSPKVLYLH